jgi:uncharacterized protein YabN with tetrapyrrole methylase and pyrophosphatase domain
VPSLLPHLVEETWEVFEAVRSRKHRGLPEELGDVLYTTLFLILIAERHGWFTLEQVLRMTRNKMVRRHPHVFRPGARVKSAREAYRNWQASKGREGKRRHSPSDAFRNLLVAGWDRLYRTVQATQCQASASDRPMTSPRTKLGARGSRNENTGDVLSGHDVRRREQRR